MKAKTIIQTLMRNKNITQVALTDMMNLKTQSAVSSALNRDMKITSFLRFVDALGGELIVRNTETGEEYKITE